MISAFFSGIFGIIAGVFGLILYILTAIGLYTMAKNYGLGNAWIAWIPVLQFYLIGQLIGNKILGIPQAKWVLLLAPLVVGIIASFVNNGMVIWALNFLVYLLEAAAYYKLFQIYKPQSAVLYLITGLIITPLLGLYIFLIRNNSRHAIAE